MTKANTQAIQWLSDVADHNYTAAASYLALILSTEQIAEIIAALKLSPIVAFKAKDIFRASQLSLLGVSNFHVEKDRNKIQEGKALSPILLLRDKLNAKVVIADGYHRLCAIYEFDEDALIQCKIV